MEGVFIFNRDSFENVESYIRETEIAKNNLLLERTRLLHLNYKDFESKEFNEKYLIGKDSFKPYSDMGKQLDIYKMLGIEVLRIETERSKTTISLVLRNPNYDKSIGIKGDTNYIPSTYSFIKDYQPKSGYKKDE